LNFVKSFLKGIAIGAGAILPGISSGVLCVIFGIYEKLLNCILNFFKNIKYNFKFLFPIALGCFCGILLFGNILKYIFYAYPVQTKSLFIGLILGSIPELLKKACTKQTFKFRYLIYLLASFLFGLALVFIESKIQISSSSNSYSYAFIFLSGLLMSAGVIIPGVSSTLILMLLGIYDAYLISISSLYLPFLIPLILGLSVGCIICMKLIRFLLDKFHTQTFLCIIGFTVGSIFVLYPGISFDIEGLTGLLCLILGFSLFCKSSS
jgi:putative membrane protein